ncbi:MAG: M90 family metallopeptidase [Steroidobacteraceae bacterium]|nr:zinc-dependent peptidase [Steroidobacteraceae bacterium]MBP7013342.1 zinc-dependent peptidase [Steroidobacteraceae bacterium]
MSTAIAAILAVAVAVLAGLLLPPLLRRRRRRLAFSQALPEPMRAAIARNVPISRALPLDLARRLEGLVIAFLAEKQFVGCNGLAITDEIRATIAAQACLLLLGRPGLYDELQSILVYPGTFWVEDEVHDDDGLVTQRRRELSGEAWDSHRIILSWEDIAETARRPADGYNVVLHEFAHYLDAEGRGLAPRAAEASRESPSSGRARAIDAWHKDLVAEYAALCDTVDRGEPTFLDPYAAEDEIEFFAVASEEFIECPTELRTAHSRLYALMRKFYGIDPAAWMEGR